MQDTFLVSGGAGIYASIHHADMVTNNIKIISAHSLQKTKVRFMHNLLVGVLYLSQIVMDIDLYID